MTLIQPISVDLNDRSQRFYKLQGRLLKLLKEAGDELVAIETDQNRSVDLYREAIPAVLLGLGESYGISEMRSQI